MYILSQDKKNLIEFERLELSKAFGTFSIIAHGICNSNFVSVASYDNEEQAKQEFHHIMDALRQGEIIYEVR